MRLSSEGIAFLEAWEGFEAEPYICAAGVLTIGFGRVIDDIDAFPYSTPISKAIARKLLAEDVAWAEAAVLRNIRVPLEQWEFDALVSFTFNCGAGALQRSTARRRINRGDMERGADALLMWCKGGQPLRVIRGLANRRAAERDVFLNGYAAEEVRRAA